MRIAQQDKVRAVRSTPAFTKGDEGTVTLIDAKKDTVEVLWYSGTSSTFDWWECERYFEVIDSPSGRFA